MNADLLLPMLTGLVPEMILGVAACVLFVGGTMRVHRNLWGSVAVAALIAAGFALYLNPLQHVDSPSTAETLRYAGPVVLDRLALFLRAVSILGGIILVLVCWDSMPENRAAEYHACLLLMVAGMGLSGAANELVTLFLALESTSIPTYLILYLGKSAQPGEALDAPAQEAAMKYFLLSVFSSALTLFGFSYLYGLAGTTNVEAIAEAFRRAGDQIASLERVGRDALHSGELEKAADFARSAEGMTSRLMGMGMVALVMVVAGLGFRLTAVPFHFYAPDVYQGTTTANAAVLAFVPKVAGFAALVRVLGFVLPTLSHGEFAAAVARPILSDQLPVLLWIMAVVTMSLGNVLGLLQENLRRLLAYSSVAHAGYMLIGLAVAPTLLGASDPMVDGVDTVFFYLVTYGAMTIGTFALLHYLSLTGQRATTMDDLAGLSRTRPGLALLMILFLFSLIGIPLTAGFMGKFLIFAGALQVPPNPAENGVWLTQRVLFISLAAMAAINAAIGGWYYLRIAAVMYLREPPPVVPTTTDRGERGWSALAAVWLCALLTIGIGVFPASLKQAVQAALPRQTDLAPRGIADQPAAAERDVADAADR